MDLKESEDCDEGISINVRKPLLIISLSLTLKELGLSILSYFGHLQNYL